MILTTLKRYSLAGAIWPKRPPSLGASQNRHQDADDSIDVEIYSKPWCPYCSRAFKLLQSKGIEFKIIDVSTEVELEKEMIRRSDALTVPQIFLRGEAVGGYDDLARLDASGKLDRMLQELKLNHE